MKKLSDLYNISSRGNLRNEASKGFVRPTLKQVLSPYKKYFNGVQRRGLNLHDYTTVFYVETTGNDTTGDGSKTTPYATVVKAINEAVGKTAIIIGAGYFSYNSLIDKDITFYGDGMNTFLDITGFCSGESMSNYNTFINLTIYKAYASGDGYSRVYLYVYNSGFPKLLFKNVLFKYDTDGVHPNNYPIFTHNNRTSLHVKDIYYNHCTFEPLFSTYQNSIDGNIYDHFSNCVARNDFISEPNNLINATLDSNFNVISSNPDNMGIYGGEFPWEV